jgi:hypothetical protein
VSNASFKSRKSNGRPTEAVFGKLVEAGKLVGKLTTIFE